MNDTLSQRLRQARLDRHMSVRELHRLSGVAVGTIRRIEQDGRVPYDYTLSKLAQALGVEISDLEAAS